MSAVSSILSQPAVRSFLSHVRRSFVWQLLLALGLTGVITFLGRLLATAFHSDVPVMWFMVAVLVSALIGGLISGLAATAVSFVVYVVFFIYPFQLSSTLQKSDQLRLILFTLESVGMTLIIESLHIARQLEVERRSKLMTREVELEKANQKVTAILESISNAFFTLDKRGRFTYLNSRAEAILERSKELLLGKNIWQTFPNLRNTEFEKNYKAAKKFKKTLHFEEKFEPSHAWYEVHVYPSLEGVSIYFDDITERKQAALALKETETKMMALANSPLIGITFSDIDGRITYANEAFLKMIGSTKDDLEAKMLNWRTLTPSEWLPKDMQAIMKAKISGTSPIFEKEYFRKDGSRVPVLMGFVLHGENRQNSVAFVMDITARKQLERQKDEFLGVVSHELKTPVTSLKVYSQLLQRKYKNDDQSTYLILSKMESQINKLVDFINDILDSARLETGKFQFHNESFAFDELVEEVVRDLQLTTAKHKLIIKGKVNTLINSDRQRLSQVMVNLLSNAIKYSPNPGEIEVKINLNNKNESITYCVKDNGIGIPKAKQKHLFQRFYRTAEVEEGHYPGVGLGLYICSEIIRYLGGKIWFTSKENKGSEFCFSLPIKV